MGEVQFRCVEAKDQNHKLDLQLPHMSSTQDKLQGHMYVFTFWTAILSTIRLRMGARIVGGVRRLSQGELSNTNDLHVMSTW